MSTDENVNQSHFNIPYPVRERGFCSNGNIITIYFLNSNGSFSHSTEYISFDILNIYIQKYSHTILKIEMEKKENFTKIYTIMTILTKSEISVPNFDVISNEMNAANKTVLN